MSSSLFFVARHPISVVTISFDGGILALQVGHFLLIFVGTVARPPSVQATVAERVAALQVQLVVRVLEAFPARAVIDDCGSSALTCGETMSLVHAAFSVDVDYDCAPPSSISITRPRLGTQMTYCKQILRCPAACSPTASRGARCIIVRLVHSQIEVPRKKTVRRRRPRRRACTIGSLVEVEEGKS